MKSRPKHNPVKSKFNGTNRTNIPIDTECPLNNEDQEWRQSLRPQDLKVYKKNSITELNPPEFYQDEMKKWDTKFKKSI